MFQAKKYTGIIPLRKKVILLALYSIPPTIILLILRSILEINLVTIILLGSGYLFMYLLMLFLFKGLDKYDLMILKSVKNNLFNKKIF
jgi:hypothetical protein